MEQSKKIAIWMTIKEIVVCTIGFIFTFILFLALAALIVALLVASFPYGFVAVVAISILFIVLFKIKELYKQNLNRLK
jgi:hypothetical protein